MPRKINNRFHTSFYAGDTSDIFYVSPYPNGDGGVNNLTTQAYTCTMELQSTLGGVPVVSKTITNKSTDLMYFECAWEPADTSGITPGNYIWVIQVAWASATPVFNKEYHIDVVVKTEGIS